MSARDAVDWQAQAIWWRWLAGQDVAQIVQAWAIGTETVEATLRGVARDQPGPVAHREVDEDATDDRPRVTTRRRAPHPPPRKTPGRRSPGRSTDNTDWHARARQALRGAPAAAACSELVTRLRIPDDERKVATTRLWSALQALVKAGEVQRTGTRYALITKEVA